MLAMCLYHHAILSVGGRRKRQHVETGEGETDEAEHDGDGGELLEAWRRPGDAEDEQGRAGGERDPGGDPVERRGRWPRSGRLR